MLSHTELHLPKADENILNVYAISMIREKIDIVVTKQNTQIRSYSEVKNGVRLQEFLWKTSRVYFKYTSYVHARNMICM